MILMKRPAWRPEFKSSDYPIRSLCNFPEQDRCLFRFPFPQNKSIHCWLTTSSVSAQYWLAIGSLLAQAMLFVSYFCLGPEPRGLRRPSSTSFFRILLAVARGIPKRCTHTLVDMVRDFRTSARIRSLRASHSSSDAFCVS